MRDDLANYFNFYIKLSLLPDIQPGNIDMIKRLPFLLKIFTPAVSVLMLVSCQKQTDTEAGTSEKYPAIARQFAGKINPESLENYSAQVTPGYITKSNAGGINVNDAKATLGRVLFYDNNLSVNNTISCGSCHKQEFGFSDTAAFSTGVLGGSTGRHSMRLINAKFANEMRFFWDERAATLSQQTTQPIKDHAEMGFSGENGRPQFATLLTKLESIDYYRELFTFVYNDTRVTEQRMQECLTHFIMSIQSFDAKFDEGRRQVPNDGAPFPNYTALENQGKQLFLAPPVFNPAGLRVGGGAGCQGCHRAPEFDIDPNSRNNGVIAAKGGGVDITNTRSPSLRDLINANGKLNGPLMHTGFFKSLNEVISHYNAIPGDNANLDPRLRPAGRPQQLALNDTEKQALVAFLQTLSGKDVYTNAKWSSPF
jgi:cytochrome c peroxidase